MWNLEKIESYIENRVEENIHLDYKAAAALDRNSDAKKNEIAKDVSAFANSDGGIIIYGIKESQGEQPRFPEKIDSINKVEFTQETLEQIINSRISPKIHGIIITPISIGTKENNQVVYVVEIPKSNTAHQAKDKRYYRRYNFESQMMDDWEIKDIINRQNKSKILVWLEPSDHTFIVMKSQADSKINLSLWIQNAGNRMAEYVDVFICGKLENAKCFFVPKPAKFEDSFEVHINNEISHKIPLEDKEFTINIQRRPILPKVSILLEEIVVSSNSIINNIDLEIIISTEDDRVILKKKISEFIQFEK
jgi:hypothetical protein